MNHSTSTLVEDPVATVCMLAILKFLTSSSEFFESHFSIFANPSIQVFARRSRCAVDYHVDGW